MKGITFLEVVLGLCALVVVPLAVVILVKLIVYLWKNTKSFPTAAAKHFREDDVFAGVIATMILPGLLAVSLIGTISNNSAIAVFLLAIPVTALYLVFHKTMGHFCRRKHTEGYWFKPREKVLKNIKLAEARTVEKELADRAMKVNK